MGPTTHTSPGALSLKVEYLQGAPPSVEPLTHTMLQMQVLQTLHGSGLVCWLLLSLLAILYTRRRDVGGVFQPWGKGLNCKNGGLSFLYQFLIKLSGPKTNFHEKKSHLFLTKTFKQKIFPSFDWAGSLEKFEMELCVCGGGGPRYF